MNKAITIISLRGNELGGAGASALAHTMKANTTVTAIDLGINPGFGSKGASAFASALRMNSVVTSIDLYGNHIQARGASALAEMMKTNTVLTNVDLGRNKIGDAGASALATALKLNTSVSTISMGETREGDQEIYATIHDPEINHQRMVQMLLGNHIGPKGASALAEALKVNKVVHEVHLQGEESK